MQVVYDARGIQTGHATRGIGRVVRELIEALARIERRDLVVGADSVPPPPLRHRRARARVFGGILTPGAFSRRELVVRLSPVAPSSIDAHSVVCCYDLIPLKAPGDHFPLHRIVRYPAPWLAYHHSLETIRQAGRVWTISEAVARDVVSMLGVPSSRVRPVPLAPSSALRRPISDAAVTAARARHGLEGDYLLWLLGGTNENKNIPGMLAATRSRDLPPLVIAGALVEWVRDKVLSVAKRCGAPEPRFLGYVPDDDLACLLYGAAAVVVPSVDEGYGLPVAEAITCGSRVAASDIPVLREVGGDEATYGDARDPSRFRDAIITAMGSPRPPARRRRTWDDVAREVSDLAHGLKDELEGE